MVDSISGLERASSWLSIFGRFFDQAVFLLTVASRRKTSGWPGPHAPARMSHVACLQSAPQRASLQRRHLSGGPRRGQLGVGADLRNAGDPVRGLPGGRRQHGLQACRRYFCLEVHAPDPCMHACSFAPLSFLPDHCRFDLCMFRRLKDARSSESEFLKVRSAFGFVNTCPAFPTLGCQSRPFLPLTSDATDATTC